MGQIWGEAIWVIDGDTFEMEVSHIDRESEYEYNRIERIRIEGLDAPELDEPDGLRSRKALTRRVRGEHLRIDIFARDRYRRLIGNMIIE